MVKDYETIEEPIIEDGVFKTHTSIQQLISRIEFLKGNIIPNLETYKGYRLLFDNDVILKKKLFFAKKRRLKGNHNPTPVV